MNVFADALTLCKLELSLELLQAEFKLGQLTLSGLAVGYLCLQLETEVFDLALCLDASLLHHEGGLSELLLQLRLLFIIRLDKREQGSMLVPFHIGHKELILCFQIAQLVTQA